MTPFAAVWATWASLTAPLARPYLRRRARRGKEIADRLREREGRETQPRPADRLIWLHAASVGETTSILPVIEGIADATVLVTTGTVTSAKLLAARVPLGGRVLHRFVPLDVPRWIGRFLDHWRPDAAGMVESELWPNMLRQVRRRGIRAVLINARLSPRSARRWARAPRFARDVLGAFMEVLAQSPDDARRFRALGATNVTALGNLKWAAPPLPADEARLAGLRDALGDRPVWIAVSTHPGEEAIIAAVHWRLAAARPGLVTIVAPRHPERGSTLSRVHGAGRHGARDNPRGLWIFDRIGELGLIYRLSRVAFVGRSLVPPGGGQNVLEAARLGCAVAVGPYTANFVDAVGLLDAAGALTRVDGEDALAAWVTAMLDDPGRATRAGDAGRAALSSGEHVLAATLDALHLASAPLR